MQSVAIIDDDPKIVQLLETYFQKEGFVTLRALDGLEGYLLIRERKPDIVILDLMLPGLDGLEICRRLRKESDVPIIMLTARDEETDRLVGLEIGADDYVTKPFSPKEVVARAKVILRRAHRQMVKPEPIKAGSLLIDLEAHLVFNHGAPVDLTPTEFRMLELLARNPGRAFTRLQIAEKAQGCAFEGYERTVDAHIKNLRYKIEENPKTPKIILTVYGVGYKLAGE